MPTSWGDQIGLAHMERTGGTSLSQALRALAPIEHERPHAGALEIPPGRPLLGTVRDPWSWYVSTALVAWTREAAWARPFMRPTLMETVEQMVQPGAATIAGFRAPCHEDWPLYSAIYARAYCAEHALDLSPNDLATRHAELCLLWGAVDVRRGGMDAVRSALGHIGLQAPLDLPRAAMNPVVLREPVADLLGDALCRLIAERDPVGWVVYGFRPDGSADRTWWAL